MDFRRQKNIFFREDWRKAPELVTMLEDAGQPVPEWLAKEAVR